MKALSLWQPHATLCVLGEKQWETRPWRTKYRGPIAIASTRRTPKDWLAMADKPFFGEALARHDDPELFHGYILGTVEIADCITTKEWIRRFCNHRNSLAEREYAFGDYGPNRFAFELQNPRRLKVPVFCRGGQRIWNVETITAGYVTEELAA